MTRNGPTIEDLLHDPLIGAVMRADGVEPQALRTLLSDASARLARRPPAPRSSDRRPRPLAPAVGPRPPVLADPPGMLLCCG